MPEQKLLMTGEKTRLYAPGDSRPAYIIIDPDPYYSILVKMSPVSLWAIEQTLNHLYNEAKLDPICIFYSAGDHEVFCSPHPVYDFATQSFYQECSPLSSMTNIHTGTRIDLIEIPSLTENRIMFGFFSMGERHHAH